MITVVGLLLWLLMGLAFANCLRLGALRFPRSWMARFGVALLAVALALLLFRPDEELEAGEDAGAYFNAALSFARSQGLFAPDPGLALLPAEARAPFRYGHAGFLHTKDAVLWAQDSTFDRIAPHFFPGYSVLLSVPVALGAPYLMFPLSALLPIAIGMLLALLARWLTGRALAGWIAFGLFLLNPAVVWNARCLRAEWPASFLALSGIVLWLAHNVRHQRVSPAQAFWGGLALAAASWFHVTAFYVMIPTVLASLWLTRRSVFWTAWWCGLVLGCGVFLAQVIWITDPYWLKNILSDAPRRNPFFLAGILGLAGMVGMRWTFKHFNWSRFATRIHAGRFAGGLMSLGCLLIILFSLRYRSDQGVIPGLPAWTASYVSLTDFDGVRRIFSRVGFGVALAGMIALCVRSGMAGRLGRGLFLLLAPASLTIGWVVNYMFETRRMVGFLIPLLVLATTVLLVQLGGWLVGGKRWLERTFPLAAVLRRLPEPSIRIGLPCLFCALLFAAALRGRSHLYTTWNNRGTYPFYRELAEDLRASGDFLFAEYTQTAAPLERLSGLPLLPIAWGYRSEAEYREAERVFERLVRQHPQRRHLLVTPFAGAALPGLLLQPLERRRLSTVRLARARRAVPMAVNPRTLTMHVHQVRLPEPPLQPQPYTRQFDGGGLGLAGAANFVPGRALALEGVPIPAQLPTELAIPMSEAKPNGRLVLIFHHGGDLSPERVTIRAHHDPPHKKVHWFAPTPGWIGADLSMAPPESGELALLMESETDLLLTDLFWQDEAHGQVVRLQVAAEPASRTLASMDSQWLRAQSAVALPSTLSGGDLWILASHGRPDLETVHVALRHRQEPQVGAEVALGSGWRWLWVPVPPVATPSGFGWHDLTVDPPWDPELCNFPQDLGIRVHVMTLVPRDA